MIRTSDAKAVATALRERYDPLRAVTLIARLLQKALFTGRANEVVFWALVHAHYCGGSLSPLTEEQLAAFSQFILTDPADMN